MLHISERNSYKLDKGRVVVSTGGVCPLGCEYCYTYSNDYKRRPNLSPYELAFDLRTFENRIDTIQLGCDTELFLHQKDGSGLVKALSILRKDISFATKMALSDETVESLVQSSERMRVGIYPWDTPRSLVAFVSLIGFETARRYEPKAPSPERRIETVKKLHAAGIPTYVFVRPLLPIITDDELNRLFDATASYCRGYVLGKFYSDQPMLEKLRIRPQATEKKRMAWNIEDREWDVLLDERIERLVDGKTVFQSSLDAVDSVRGKKYHEAIIQGNPQGSLSDMILYSMRLSVPADVKVISVVSRCDDLLHDLHLERNVFTGEAFSPPTMNDIAGILDGRKLTDHQAKRIQEMLSLAKNRMILEQPANAHVDMPRAILLEDGRMYTFAGLIGERDLRAEHTKELLDYLKGTLKSQNKLISICEAMEHFVINQRKRRISRSAE